MNSDPSSLDALRIDRQQAPRKGRGWGWILLLLIVVIGAGIWWWLGAPIGVAIVLFLGLYLLFSSVNEFIDPRTRLRRIGA